MTLDALDRRALRAHLIARRGELDAHTHAQLSARIVAHARALVADLAPRSIGFCWPWRGEVDLSGMIATWLAEDDVRRAALPVVDDGHVMRFLRWRPGDVLVADRFGILSPADGESIQPELLLIPANGFDASGYRLGYGGGYFDRALASWRPRPVTVGIAFAMAAVPDLLPEPHDVPMDWVITEDGCVVRP